jgi:hypothetical protein
VTPVEHPVVDTTEADAAEVLLAPDDVPQPDATPPWNYGAPGDVCIPHAHLDAQVLRLLPFVRWERADATTTTYRVTTDRIARAIRQGYSDTQLWTLLERQAGPLPAGWDDGFRSVTSRLHLHHQAIVMQNAECRMQNAGQMRNGECSMQHAACRTDRSLRERFPFPAAFSIAIAYQNCSFHAALPGLFSLASEPVLSTRYSWELDRVARAGFSRLPSSDTIRLDQPKIMEHAAWTM